MYHEHNPLKLTEVSQYRVREDCIYEMVEEKGRAEYELSAHKMLSISSLCDTRMSKQFHDRSFVSLAHWGPQDMEYSLLLNTSLAGEAVGMPTSSLKTGASVIC